MEVGGHRQSGWPCSGDLKCPIGMRGTAHTEPVGFGLAWSAGVRPWRAALALPLASELGGDRERAYPSREPCPQGVLSWGGGSG